ncbi:MAG: glycoside hydrolase family 76 protein [Acidobacteriota bacterium]
MENRAKADPPEVSQVDAERVFGSLHTAWNQYVEQGDDPKYWWVGNALGAALTFAEHWSAVGGAPSVLEPLAGMVSYGFRQVFPKGFNSGSNWFDDHGWWALALIQAYEQGLQGNGDSKDDYLRAAWNVWHLLRTKAWDEEGAPGLPAGGCWNKNPDLGGAVKNTVVNGLYLTLSARLARFGEELSSVVPGSSYQDCADAAQASYRWWSEWIQPASSVQYPPLANNMANQPQWLVRDTATPLDGDNAYLQCVITQEQGLLIAGLAELVAMGQSLQPGEIGDPDATLSPEDLLKSVAGAVLAPFFPGESQIVQEPPFSFQFGVSPLGDYRKDESTGRGGLLRFLSQHRDVVGRGFDKPFESTAGAASQANQKGSTLDPDWVVCEDRQAAVRLWATIWGVDPGATTPPFLLSCGSSAGSTCGQCLFGGFLSGDEGAFLCRTNEVDAMSAFLSNTSRDFR